MHGEHILFLLETVLQRFELCNLMWSDFDRVHKIITIQESKTTAGKRIVPLTDLAYQIILMQKKRKGHDYIFTCRSHTKLTPSSLERTYMRLRKETGIKILTNHVCRHTFATRLIENGADPKAVSALLGHTSVSFTLDHYVSALQDFLAVQIMLRAQA